MKDEWKINGNSMLGEVMPKTRKSIENGPQKGARNHQTNPKTTVSGTVHENHAVSTAGPAPGGPLSPQCRKGPWANILIDIYIYIYVRITHWMVYR
jgi:hypothetical protein